MELLGAFQKPCLTRMVQAPAFPCSGSYINQLKAPRKWPYHLKGVSSNAAQQYQNPKYLKAHTMFLFLVTVFWDLDPIQPQSLAPRWSRRRRAPPAAPEGPAATGTPYGLFALSPQQRRDLIDSEARCRSRCRLARRAPCSALARSRTSLPCVRPTTETHCDATRIKADLRRLERWLPLANQCVQRLTDSDTPGRLVRDLESGGRQVASHQKRNPFLTHFKGSKHNHSVVVHTLGPKRGCSNPFKADVWTMELLGAFQKPCLTRMVQAPVFPYSGSYINQLKSPRKWPYHLKGVSSNAAQQYQNPKYLKAHTIFLFLVSQAWRCMAP